MREKVYLTSFFVKHTDGNRKEDRDGDRGDQETADGVRFRFPNDLIRHIRDDVRSLKNLFQSAVEG